MFGVLFSLIFFASFLTATDVTEANYFTLPVTNGTLTSFFDHDTPDYTDNSYFVRYDGQIWSDGSASLASCTNGVNCYDGHNGVDFATTSGANVLAAAPGVVEDVYWNSCGGWTMQIWHGTTTDLSTLYAHIGTTTVATTSDVVVRGQHVAGVDSTGSCADGDHLHFGVTDGQSPSSNRIDPYGWWDTTAVDPWPYNQGYLWTTDPPSRYITSTTTSNISATTTWRGNYLVDASITVNSGKMLTISPGTVVKFNGLYQLFVDGILDARGTASLPIYFTSVTDDSVWGDTNNDGFSAGSAGSWRNIKVTSTASTTIANATVSYGGGTGGGVSANLYNLGGILNLSDVTIASSTTYGIYTGSSGTTTISSATIRNQGVGSYVTGSSVSITNSTIRNNSSAGVEGPSGALTITGSTFSNNSGGAGNINGALAFIHSNNTATGSGKKFVIHDNVNADRTWYADNIPYVIDSPIDVNSGKTLIIEAGTIIKPASSSFNPLTVYGTLDVQGTSGSKVYFTSLNDDTIGGDTGDDGASTPVAGNWRGIKIESGASTTLAHTIIRYGGASGFGSSQANVANSGVVSITNSQVATSSTYGVRNDSGTTTVSNSEVNHNSYGFYIPGGVVNAASSSIHHNTSYGMYKSTTPTTTAQYNFWGNSSGPTHSSHPSGTGDTVTNFIDFTNYLSTWP